MTNDNIDVDGFHSPAELPPLEEAVIDNLLASIRSSTLELIRINKEKRELKEKREGGLLWPRFKCGVLSEK